MLVERKEVVVTPVEDSSTSVGMMLLIAIIVLAVGITAVYFATAGQNTQYIERTTETNNVTPAPTPAPVQQPFVLPAAAPTPAPQTNTIVVPQPVAAPAAPAASAPAAAPAAPAAPAASSDAAPAEAQ